MEVSPKSWKAFYLHQGKQDPASVGTLWLRKSFSSEIGWRELSAETAFKRKVAVTHLLKQSQFLRLAGCWVGWERTHFRRAEEVTNAAYESEESWIGGDWTLTLLHVYAGSLVYACKTCECVYFCPSWVLCFALIVTTSPPFLSSLKVVVMSPCCLLLWKRELSRSEGFFCLLV